jgi:hypothetical protein
MISIKKLLPGFKATCLIVGILDILLAGSMFASGIMKNGRV